MIFATCLTIAAALANAKGGETIRLTGDCPSFSITRTYNPPVTVEAFGSTVRNLRITNGGGLIWRGGTFRAPVGYDAVGPSGYGASLNNASNVTIEGATFQFSNKSLVVNSSTNVAVRFNRFEIGGDAIIAAGGKNYDFSHNVIIGVAQRPTRCTVGSVVTEGLSSTQCAAINGKWVDGWHQDAIQLRNGITNTYVLGNVIRNTTQGIGEMAASTDLPLYGVRVEGNDVSVSGFHSITIGSNSTDVVIIDNRVEQTTGRRTVIRSGNNAIVCGNIVQKAGDPGAQPCK